MPRTTELDVAQYAVLERLAEQTHTTVDELPRVAIHNVLEHQLQADGAVLRLALSARKRPEILVSGRADEHRRGRWRAVAFAR
ncbi:MAG: hypothetical protein IT307_13040 [Chloroflexi bacterium]|nr:hypothetical protein [Chloroflexota bacterium]